MRGNIIIALECVNFWLPQVPSFHKLFKSLPPTNKEKMAEDRESVQGGSNISGTLSMLIIALKNNLFC
jgi:hypothetical protein